MAHVQVRTEKAELETVTRGSTQWSLRLYAVCCRAYRKRGVLCGEFFSTQPSATEATVSSGLWLMFFC